MLKTLIVWMTTNWKILKEVEVPDHFTCVLRKLYASDEATVRNRHGRADWFKIGKGVYQGCISSSCLFKLYAEYIMQNAELCKAQAGIKMPGKISINSAMQMIPPYGKKWRGTKGLLDEVERREWKSWLKTQHSKKNEDHGIWMHYFMANRWGEMEGFFSCGPKSLWTLTAVMKLKDAFSLEEKIWPI